MAEIFVMSDGDQSHTTGDEQKLINESNGWGKLKRNRYKLLVVGLTVAVLVSCIVALAVTHTPSTSTDQSASVTNDQPNSENRNSEESRNHPNKLKQRRQKLGSHPGNFNEARQFAIAFPSVYWMQSDYNEFECMVVAREQTTVTFDSHYLGLDKSIVLPPGVARTESFDSSIQTTYFGIEDKAIYITADKDIIVQCAGADGLDMDSFLALPYDANATEYYLAVCDDYAMSSSADVGFVNVVATVDNTEVNIKCPQCPGENYIVELQRYQTYALYVEQYSDLTGFHITATNPVSVFTGSPYLEFYDGVGYTYHQFLTFSVPPLHQLGTLHYAPETSGDPNLSHRIRIVATDNTNVLIPHKGVDVTLERYEFFTQDYSYFVESVGPLEVSCSTRCLVIHCNKEHQPYTENAYMMRVIPTEAYSDNIVFETNDYFRRSYFHFVSIVANQYPVTDLYLDGNSLSNEDWTPTLSGNQAGIMMTVTPGFHRLNTTNEAKFAAYSHSDGRNSHPRFGYGNIAGVGTITGPEQPPGLFSTEILSNTYKRLNDHLASRITKIEEASNEQRYSEAWATINEVSGRRKSTAGQVEGKSAEDRVQTWYKHFSQLLGKPPQVSDEDNHIHTVFDVLPIDEGPFTLGEYIKAKKSLKLGKSVGPDGISAEVLKLCDLDEQIL